MKIYQVCGTLTYGDGIGNIVLYLEKFLKQNGYESYIIVNNLDSKIDRNDILIVNKVQDFSFGQDDIIIYHMANGVELNNEMEHLECKKILLYHNITPPSLFREINRDLAKDCAYGIEDAKVTSGKFLKAITLSEFSKRDLVSYGWKEEDVISIPIINKDIVRYELDRTVLEKYSDDYINFLFVGRVAPNKKLEDVIRIFGYYQKNICPTSRLFFVGKVLFENYYIALKEYADYLNVRNVNFVNFVSNEELESYYKIADAFLCMSEHEGFCIPLVEAMSREIPVIAYSSTAVKDTMGDAGVLVSTKDEKVVCEEIRKVLEDKEYYKQIVDSQNKRVCSFNIDNYENDLIDLIDQVKETDNREEVNEDIFSDILYKANKKMLSEPDDNIILNQEVLAEQGAIIIYGIGKAGKRFYNGLSDEIKQKVVAFCDEKMAGNEFDSISILNIDECVQLHPSTLYVVTPQMDFIDIMFRLFQMGVSRKCIAFYNMNRRLLIL